MFEAITKAISEVQEQDEQKFQRRKSKRMSAAATARHTLLALRLNEDDLQTSEDTEEGEDNKQGRGKEVAPDRVSTESDIEEDEDDLIEDRAKWSNDYDAVIFMIAFAVGGSNVWRFGFLCYTYGGVVFLIPYFFLTLVCALPCVYLELIIGQYSQVGAIAAWKLAPLFKGVGMCMTLLSFMVCFNIQTILSWCLHYIFQSIFHNPLPWISCDNGFTKRRNGQTDLTKEKWIQAEEGEDENKNWHTENCTEFFADSGDDGSLGINERLPGSEYFRGRVQRMWKSGYADRTKEMKLEEDNGIIKFGLDARGDLGVLEYNTDTLFALIAVFIIIELLIARGIKTNAKVLIVLTIAPYVWLVLLFYRATGLNGAWQGLVELFKPDISKLFDADTWWKCAEQVFYSTGAGYGVHLTCASHNPYNRRIVYDAIAVVIVNSLTSFLSACTIFMFLGHVKVAVNRELKIFVRSGPELVFEVMSDVLGVLAKANFYAFAFYLFIFLIALTTVTTTLIGTKTAYLEVLPVSIKYKTGARIMLMVLIYLSSFIITSLNLTRGGLHTYNFINTFGGLYSLVLSAFLFIIGFTWFFGLREIVEATQAMHIRSPGIYFQLCWKFVSPVVLATVFVGLLLEGHRVEFDGKHVPLGIGLQIVGYVIAIGPFLSVIVGAAHALWKAPGKNFKEKLLTSISPRKEHKDILATGTGKRATFSHYFYFYASTPGTKCNICCSLHRRSKVAPEINIHDTERSDLDKSDTSGSENVNGAVVTVPVKSDGNQSGNEMKSSNLGSQPQKVEVSK